MAKKRGIKLTGNEEQFCRCYTSDRECYGNGSASYIEAYQPPRVGNWADKARIAACRMIARPHIVNRINELLEKGGLNVVNADKQLGFLMSQHQNFNAKLGAIKQFNELHNRIVQKVDFLSGGKPLVSHPFEDRRAIEAFHDALRLNMHKRSDVKAQKEGEIDKQKQ